MSTALCDGDSQVQAVALQHLWTTPRSHDGIRCYAASLNPGSSPCQGDSQCSPDHPYGAARSEYHKGHNGPFLRQKTGEGRSGAILALRRDGQIAERGVHRTAIAPRV